MIEFVSTLYVYKIEMFLTYFLTGEEVSVDLADPCDVKQPLTRPNAERAGTRALRVADSPASVDVGRPMDVSPDASAAPTAVSFDSYGKPSGPFAEGNAFKPRGENAGRVEGSGPPAWLRERRCLSLSTRRQAG